MHMDHERLQERIRTGDPTAFRDFSDRYGWDVYSSLSQRIRDQEALKAAYTEIMSEVYRNAGAGKLEGDLESALTDAVNRYCGGHPDKPVAEEKPAGAGFWIMLILLLALNGICLWLIGGILMEMGILPAFDLGYSWLKSILFA